MLVVDYKKKLGEVVIEQENHKFTIGIYQCNALFAVVWHPGKEDVTLYMFFWEKKHLKRCLKDKIFNEVVSWKINIAAKTKYGDKMLDVALMLAKAGEKVEIYYDEEKKEGK